MGPCCKVFGTFTKWILIKTWDVFTIIVPREKRVRKELACDPRACFLLIIRGAWLFRLEGCRTDPGTREEEERCRWWIWLAVRRNPISTSRRRARWLVRWRYAEDSIPTHGVPEESFNGNHVVFWNFISSSILAGIAIRERKYLCKYVCLNFLSIKIYANFLEYLI